MFTAINSHGETICLLHLQKDSTKMRATTWHCPQCHEEVIYKNGLAKRPHFAHTSQSICSKKEEETEEHLQGKQQLYEWLRPFADDLEIEKWLPDVNQRPDVWCVINGAVYVFEVQCSAIERKEIKRRSSNYFNHGIQVIWVLPERYLHRSSSSVYLQEWQLETCSVFPHSYPRLLFIGKQLQMVTLVSYLSPRKSSAFTESLPYTYSSFKKIIQPSSVNLEQLSGQLIYKNECRYGKRQLAKGLSLLVQEELLAARCPIHLHPSEVGWYVPAQVYINEPPLIWQLYVYLNLQKHQDQGLEEWIERERSEIAKQLQITERQAELAMVQYFYLYKRMTTLANRGATHPFPKSADEGHRYDQTCFLYSNCSITRAELG
ncbi:competence protein CoiA [Geomicrobium sp. JCM 19038]|uniref:competence protein CoiA n=1 Tax=Geomicrobium sp. JCM 19038 TaxID=1460635 RepID=UPI00045F126E|nr:competence protein CoiA family protein [Geomicrobium sp. JCM 19038]GAK10138.1 competence protein CoiA [Geomicrobium sp. JCM 19038]